MSLSKSNLSNLLEIYYYYMYFYKINSAVYLINTNNFYQLLKFNIKVLFNSKNTKKVYNKYFSTRSLNKFLNIKINYQYNTLDTLSLSSNTLLKKYNYSEKNNKIDFKLFNLFFLFNYSLFNTKFKPHHNFNLFYIQTISSKVILIDPIKFVSRWKEAFDFLFNIFFYNFNPLVFGSNLFKTETLALNWNYNTYDINLWKYYFPFFVFKLNNYNKMSDFFFNKLSSLNINFFLISDCQYHYKNLHYIKKKNYYSVGLVNINLDPWLVNYPIITFFESFLTQLFFFKLLIYTERKALLLKYNTFKNLWLFFLLKKNS